MKRIFLLTTLFLLAITNVSYVSAQTTINLSSYGGIWGTSWDSVYVDNNGVYRKTYSGWAWGTPVQICPYNPNGYKITTGGLTYTNALLDFVVKPGVTVTLYFDGVDMERKNTCMDVSGSNTTIVLIDGTDNKLIKTGGGYVDDTWTVAREWYNGRRIYEAALEKHGRDGSLTITCEHADEPGHICSPACGKLTVKVDDPTYPNPYSHAPAIGSASLLQFVEGTPDTGTGTCDGVLNFPQIFVATNGEFAFTNFYIKGGQVEAKGAPHGPGIGAGCSNGYVSDNKSITDGIYISGGIVKAEANDCGAGIGGGHGSMAKNIYISGTADVEARGGKFSPGIGSGGLDDHRFFGQGDKVNIDCENIVISGGQTKVTAYGDIASNTPGIGCGVDGGYYPALTLCPTSSLDTVKGELRNVKAIPETDWQGYVKYGTSATNYSYSDANPETPFPNEEEIGSFLQGQAAVGNPVYYTQVYFGPYRKHNSIDKNAEIGCNDYFYCYTEDSLPPLTDVEIGTLLKVIGHDESGNVLSANDFTVANGRMRQSEIDAINYARAHGVQTIMNVTFTYDYTALGGGHLQLNTNRDHVLFGPKDSFVFDADSSSFSIDRDGYLEATVAYQNRDSAAHTAPIYVTLYDNKIVSGNIITFDSIMTDVPRNGFGKVTIRKKVKPSLDITHIIVRFNDKNGVYPVDPTCNCSYFTDVNAGTAVEPESKWLTFDDDDPELPEWNQFNYLSDTTRENITYEKYDVTTDTYSTVTETITAGAYYADCAKTFRVVVNEEHAISDTVYMSYINFKPYTVSGKDTTFNITDDKDMPFDSIFIIPDEQSTLEKDFYINPEYVAKHQYDVIGVVSWAVYHDNAGNKNSRRDTVWLKLYDHAVVASPYITPFYDAFNRVEWGITGGSPNLMRSINGHDWVNLYSPLSEVERLSLGDGIKVYVREPAGCKQTILTFTLVDPSIERYVYIPKAESISTNPIAGYHYVEGHDDFTFTAQYAGEPITFRAHGFYSDSIVELKPTILADGLYQYTIKQVVEPWNIAFVTPTNSGETSNTYISDGNKISAYGNTLTITTDKASTVRIYNMTGTLQKTVNVPAGTTSITLPRGIYVIELGSQRYKVFIK